MPHHLAATSNISPSASSQTALDTNADRRGAMFMNDSSQACYVKLGINASTSSYTVKLLQGVFYEMEPVFTGRIDVVFDNTGTGALRVTEVT